MELTKDLLSKSESKDCDEYLVNVVYPKNLKINSILLIPSIYVSLLEECILSTFKMAVYICCAELPCVGAWLFLENMINHHLEPGNSYCHN